MRLRVILVGVWLLAACASRASLALPERFTDVARYREARERLIAEDRAMRLGAGLALTPAEETANTRLMALKQAEIDRTRAHFPPAHSFLQPKTKQLIAESPVLDVMRRLPKGGILHAHGSALGDFTWLANQALARPDTYVYAGSGPQPVRGSLRFAEQSPGAGWRLLTELRAAARDGKAFDEEIRRSFTLGEEELQSPDIWEEFSNVFRRSAGVFADRAVSAEFWRRTFTSLIDENVQYLESRNLGADESVMREILSRHPEFMVTRIVAAGRSAGREQMAEILRNVVARRAESPAQLKGFDLVEEEDRTHTNLFFIEELLAARRDAEQRGVTLPFYLHSGESNWAENENLYDAILLGAPRIGHGLALIRHPRLMQIVKERGIAIEVCPISNQILGYVADLRTHPAVHYINAGLPVVLSPDDPGIMQHTFSHDFYVAFMAWGLDLRQLKQLAMNSLTYSALEPGEKEKALATWRGRWETFIQWLNRTSA